MSRRTTAVAAGELLRALFQTWEGTPRLQQYRIWQVWIETVGPQISAHAQPVRVRDGTLEVRVDQPVWMQQLQLLKPKILARLNEHLGEQPLRDIFWRRGRLSMPEDREPSAKTTPLPPLNSTEAAEIDQMVASLADPQLRRHLEGIFKRQRQLEKSRKPKT